MNKRWVLDEVIGQLQSRLAILSGQYGREGGGREGGRGKGGREGGGEGGREGGRIAMHTLYLYTEPLHVSNTMNLYKND